MVASFLFNFYDCTLNLPSYEMLKCIRLRVLKTRGDAKFPSRGMLESLVPDHTSVDVTKTVKVSVRAATLVTTAVQDKLAAAHVWVEKCQTVWPTQQVLGCCRHSS